MKNKLFNLIIGAVIALAIFSSVTTISYLREDKVLLASHCPDTYQECFQATEFRCWDLEGDQSEGCCRLTSREKCPQYNNCLDLYCW
ncbi:MAG: hypothetical protein HRU80_09560 [Ignavibacteriales bacterium]|nr:hypothetical protein [Ignavibacteriaceae bacterium]QOJ29117.1 MAG: hypothetical protein HRU80_09560 [Ignavibacteriales bacterium]